MPIDSAAEELTEQIAMCAVDLHAVEARPLGAHGGGDEVLAQSFHFFEASGPSTGLLMIGRAHRHPTRQITRRAHPGVMKLDHRDALLIANALGQPRQPFEMLVADDAELPPEPLPYGLDVGRTSHGRARADFGTHGEPTIFIVRERKGGVIK
jgi:hypothetical protein